MIGVELHETACLVSPEGDGPLVSQATPLGESHAQALKRWIADRSIADPANANAVMADSAMTDASFCIAVAANERASKLGELLGECLAERISIAGFVDAAVLAASAAGMQGVGVVLALQRQDAVATRVVETAGMQRRAAMLQEQGCGWGDLRRVCLQRIADTMIRQTRFDPLHEINDERYLADHLQAWLQQATTTGEVRIELMALGKPLAVVLSLDDFVKATEPVLRKLRGLLRDLRLPGMEQYFLLPEALLDFPGVSAMLSGFGHVPIFLMSDGLAARAAARCHFSQTHDRQVFLHRQIMIAKFYEPKRFSAVHSKPYQKPTHMLYENKVWSLATPVSIGRATDSALLLPAGLVGVSRQHCTVYSDADESVVIDHSRYGTWVNEEPVRGRQRLAAGDRLRIGDPGVELSLITVGDENGQASR